MRKKSEEVQELEAAIPEATTVYVTHDPESTRRYVRAVCKVLEAHFDSPYLDPEMVSRLTRLLQTVAAIKARHFNVSDLNERRKKNGTATK